MLVQGKLYTIWTPRGNMGSTVSAINIAKKLSKMKGKTLLIDANLVQPRIAEYLNLTDVTKTIDNLHPYALGGSLSGEIIEGNCDVIDDLYVLKGTLNPSSSEFPKKEIMDIIIQAAKDSFTYVVVDVHHNINNPGTYFSLKQADTVFIPMERDVITILALHDLRELLASYFNIEKFKLLFCQDSENIFMPIADIESNIGIRTAGVFPHIKEFQNVINKGELNKIDKNKAFKPYLSAIEDFVSKNVGEYVEDKSKKKGVMGLFGK